MQTQGYNTGSNSSTHNLSPRHREMLERGSGISPEAVAGRGYYTARSRADVPECFAGYQRRPGLVIPGLTVRGERRYRLRPDRPRRDRKGKPQKYEQVHGEPCYLDAATPRNLARAKDRTAPLWIVEGEKKQDALISRGEAAISIAGVWNYQRDGELLPDWRHIPLEGRTVYAAFDSDTWTNPNVALALARLIAALAGRGATVLTVVLEDAPDGSKIGADDFLASEAGGTVAELLARARELAPEDVARERLSRDERLAAGLEDLQRRFWHFRWRGMGGHTDRDLYAVLVDTAHARGEAVEAGVLAMISWGELQLKAKISRRTLAKSLARLQAAGLIAERVKAQDTDKSGGFVLRASVNHYGVRPGREDESNRDVTKVLPGGLHLRSPRLMWSSPGSRPRRGTVRGTRKVRQSKPPQPRPAVKRPGKIRGRVLDTLDGAGGELTLHELAAAMQHKRPRDLRRRTLPMLEDAGIIALEDGTVALTADWRERLQDVREAGGEIEAEKLAARRMAEKRAGWRDHLAEKRQERSGRSQERPKPSPSAAGVANIAESRRRRREHLERERAKPAPEPTDEQAQRIARLIGQGMSARWARDAVMGAPMPWERRAGPGQPEPEPEPHPLACECPDCSARAPRYARPFSA